MLKLQIYFAILFAGGTLQAVHSIFWPCETNTDCTALKSKCNIDGDHLCACEDFSSVFANNLTICLTTSLFGDTCDDTVQCNLMPSGAHCKSGVCDCADGQTYVRGRCRPLNDLEQPCLTDLDCFFGYDRQSVSCQQGVCACANGYYHRYGNICRRKSMEINDACIVDTDCNDLGPKAKCVNLKCQYVDEKHKANSKQQNAETIAKTEPIDPPRDAVLTNGGNGLTDTETETETDANGNAVENSVATNDDNANDKINGNANANANANGDGDGDVDKNASKSREIAVQTSIETYELKNFNITHNYRHVGTTTATTTSTSSRRPPTSTSTTTGRTRTRTKTAAVTKQQHTRSFRFDDNDNINFNHNDIDDDDIDDDEELKTYSTLYNSDDGADKQFGSSCTDNGKGCVGLPHSICANKICFCRAGYYPKQGKCYAELGEIAESSDECEFAFDVGAKTCTCQKNYFYERNMRSCKKPIHYHLACTSHSQCSPFGAAFCSTEFPRRCTCAEYAEYDEMQQLCRYKQGLGGKCQNNEGCPVDNSVCLNQVCVCKQHYFEKDGACLAGIGAECLEDMDCEAEHTACLPQARQKRKLPVEEEQKSCQCRKGFVHFKDECLQQANDIEDDCIENEQCKPLLASCVDKKCSCTEAQHFKNGRCETKKMLGEPCSKATECFVQKDPETVECRNSVCQCKMGYQAESTEQSHCIRVMPNKKNSSGRPSALKIITFVLIGSAFFITSAAIKQAYY